MKKLRIIFMGTPDFAVASLHKLVEAKYNVVGVITAVDKPAGRGRKLHESAVKKYAIENDLPVLQPKSLKNEAFLEELKALEPNLMVVVAFRMLPKVVWNMPEYGTFNLHASLLPDYRGAAPINWAIINGETESGATTFFIDDKIDTGEIILQEKIDVGESETAGELHDRLMHMGAGLVVKTVDYIKTGEVKTIKQKNPKLIKEAHKIHKDTCMINWESSIHNIYNHIRGLSPYPAAWTKLINGDDAFNIKIYSVEKEIEEHNLEIGKLSITKKEIKVAVKNGFINLLEIQMPGKRKMMVKDLLNGINLSGNAHVV